MKLKSFRVTNYRSIIDSGVVNIEDAKTIFVGPNEAGKSATLQALQQVNAPDGVSGFDALRDYPRRLYNDISTGKVDPKNVQVVEAIFALEDEEIAKLPDSWEATEYVHTRYLSNRSTHSIPQAPEVPYYKDIKSSFSRLEAHASIYKSVGAIAKKFIVLIKAAA